MELKKWITVHLQNSSNPDSGISSALYVLSALIIVEAILFMVYFINFCLLQIALMLLVNFISE